MSRLTSIIKSIAKLVCERQVIPVCGAGFSLNVQMPQHPPSWSGLIDACLANNRVRRRLECSQQLDDVRFVTDVCKDYLTALSVIDSVDPRAPRVCLRSIETATSKARLAHLPMHQTFWSIDWPLVVTTNYDNFLSTSNPHCITLDYSRPDLTRILQNEAELPDSNVVVHIHGAFASSTGGVPLVTWKDYLEAYRWNNSEEISRLASHMASTSKISGRDRHRYKAILEAQLDRARQLFQGSAPGRVVPAIDHLLANKTCLFLGFSFVDPIWRLILHRLAAVQAASTHYIIAPPPIPRHIKPMVRRVPITDYSNLSSTLHSLSANVGDLKRHDDTGERRARDFCYKHLRSRYLEFTNAVPSGFIFQGSDGAGATSIVPFTELWCNRRKLPQDVAVRVRRVSSGRFQVSSSLANLREQYWKYRKEVQEKRRDGGELVNESKIRITGAATAPNGQLDLSVQLADYMDFLVTNHLAANMDCVELNKIRATDSGLARILEQAFIVRGDFDPRETLCPNAATIHLSEQAQCSNHLGVSALLIADLPERGGTTPALLCPPTRGQVSSPKDIVMTASGSADWPLRLNARTVEDIETPNAVRRNPDLLRLPDQIWREFAEESVQSATDESRLKNMPLGERFTERFRIARSKRQNLIKKSVLINLCQNIDRGGKPELFYVASIRSDDGYQFVKKDLNYNWELAPIHSTEIVADVEKARGLRQMMCLRSPLNRDLQIVSDPEPSYRQLLSVICDNRFNPVLRAHLVAIIRWCMVLDPRTSAILRTVGRGQLTYLVGM
jgi:hypothetical protein